MSPNSWDITSSPSMWWGTLLIRQRFHSPHTKIWAAVAVSMIHCRSWSVLCCVTICTDVWTRANSHLCVCLFLKGCNIDESHHVIHLMNWMHQLYWWCDKKKKIPPFRVQLNTESRLPQLALAEDRDLLYTRGSVQSCGSNISYKIFLINLRCRGSQCNDARLGVMCTL